MDNRTPTPSPTSLSRSSSKLDRVARRRSLRLSNQPLNVPIPPSLLQSPYLNSPQSIFQRAVSAPRHPNAEDEQWLQDTVPLSRDDHTQSAASVESSPLSDASGVERSVRGRRPERRSLANAPPSPPLVRWRHTPTTPPAWFGQNKARSAPCLAMSDQCYFVSAA